MHERPETTTGDAPRGAAGGAPGGPDHGVLAGLRVADFSRVLAGPYATMMLADYGADVIKIEPPTGDDTRHWKPPVDANGTATYFGSVNRNKRSVALDLASEEGLAEARRLAATADVVIENFRPGVMRRFGLDHDTVRAENPRVVYCSITGFGAGEGAGLAGYDLLVQAVGGLMSITGEPEGEPSKAGVALVDVLCAQNALAGILLALRDRDRTGEGAHVEINLMQSLLSALTNQAASTLVTGRAPRRLGNQHPSIAPYAVFPAADRDLVIAVGNDKQFRALTAILGLPGLADDERYATNEARVAHREHLRAEIEGALAGARAAVWAERFSEAGVPAGLVNDVAEAIAFAESLGLEPVAETDGSRTVANPIRLSSARARYLTPPPRLDEHAGADWHPVTSDPTADPSKGPRA
ncbi:CaiB/BaiF CoA transferase family protein [Agromyces sp. NPDC058126]|uniref:CaiB/BaiF CoA transferase family protein n=1 Tax=Agromyces sp. NPDC058126 TaxID=3346350 RepID=UPI0036DCD841